MKEFSSLITVPLTIIAVLALIYFLWGCTDEVPERTITCQPAPFSMGMAVEILPTTIPIEAGDDTTFMATILRRSCDAPFTYTVLHDNGAIEHDVDGDRLQHPIFEGYSDIPPQPPYVAPTKK